MSRKHGENQNQLVYRNAYCAVQALLQASMHQMMQEAQGEGEEWWQDDEAVQPYDLTLLSVLGHQLEHDHESSDTDLAPALASLAAVAELLLPAVEQRLNELSDPLRRHAALVTRNILKAAISANDEELEGPPVTEAPHRANGHGVPGVNRIPNSHGS